MKSSSKIVATVLAAALAASTISIPAFAHDPQKHNGPGILPFLAGPAALGASIGTTTTAFTIAKDFKFFFWQKWGWQKIHYLKSTGWNVSKDFHHYKVKVHAEKTKHSTSSSNVGKAVVGCIMGSAFGAITAAIRKGNAMGNPLRWRSQAEHEKIVASGYEKQFELTNAEAQTAIALCGLGSFALHWPQKAPVVQARN